jgi:hypothetical protein
MNFHTDTVAVFGFDEILGKVYLRGDCGEKRKGVSGGKSLK